MDPRGERKKPSRRVEALIFCRNVLGTSYDRLEKTVVDYLVRLEGALLREPGKNKVFLGPENFLSISLIGTKGEKI